MTAEDGRTRAVRCCVCMRILGMAQATSTWHGRVYCPDRTCILYPPSPAPGKNTFDATISNWVVGLIDTTPTSAESISRALGHTAAWARHLASNHRKRWRTAA